MRPASTLGIAATCVGLTLVGSAIAREIAASRAVAGVDAIAARAEGSGRRASLRDMEGTLAPPSPSALPATSGARRAVAPPRAPPPAESEFDRCRRKTWERGLPFDFDACDSLRAPPR